MLSKRHIVQVEIDKQPIVSCEQRSFLIRSHTQKQIIVTGIPLVNSKLLVGHHHYFSSSSTTFSTWWVCGNISTGCTRVTWYTSSSNSRSRAWVAGLQLM